MKDSYIHDSHIWIQSSSKSTIGNTVCKCTICGDEVKASMLDSYLKPCHWSYCNKNSGFPNKTLEYWWVHLGLGTHSHNTEEHDLMNLLELFKKYPDRICIKIVKG